MHLNNLLAYTYVENFNANLINNIAKKVSIIYRNYKETNIDHILRIRNLCKKTGRKFYLSNNIKLAIKLSLDGAYIPSFNKSLNVKYFKYCKKFEIIGSAHSFEQIKIKEKQNISKIFISPLFKTNKSKNFLGIYRFINLRNMTKKNVICLGGLNKKNLKKIKLIKPNGFAAISLFQ